MHWMADREYPYVVHMNIRIADLSLKRDLSIEVTSDVFEMSDQYFAIFRFFLHNSEVLCLTRIRTTHKRD